MQQVKVTMSFTLRHVIFTAVLVLFNFYSKYVLADFIMLEGNGMPMVIDDDWSGRDVIIMPGNGMQNMMVDDDDLFLDDSSPLWTHI
ncbi:hypothetical protein GZH46_01105, partial [Fragariocoptes setiger]